MSTETAGAERKPIRQRIAAIDREVNTIRKKLKSLEMIDLHSAESWQTAWIKHPDLLRAESLLYCERGELQASLAEIEAPALARKQRAEKRAEIKAASLRTRVFSYLCRCKEAAIVLGNRELRDYYSLALTQWSGEALNGH